MYYVYLLKSYKNGSIYIGYTKDLKKRIELHNTLKVYSTRLLTPWELIYYEAYKSMQDATKREKVLKYDGKSKTMLKKRIENSLNNNLKGAA